ncbi:MAG: UDP-N-acetylmuramoyl-L-alanyl-D-glutamate--2,6-diaminopimelate ligase [Clostridia bacterium]|nr:UDP-N-acetylmuramoyl-L-alanyl-D-glutamate--2,6-diaminopimelate ligase [Clostridia bacterium]
MRLKYVLQDVENIGCSNYIDNIEISDVTSNLSSVRPGSVFVAVKGRNFDGHTVISKAVERGALCVVCQDDTVTDVCTVKVKDSRKALSVLCSNLNGRPSEKLTIIGITGTNGKTTTCHMLHRILSENGIRCGVIGTVESFRENDRGVVVKEQTGFTTPGPEILQPLFRKMYESGCTHVVMEVSSQALDQERVFGMDFSLGIFTNLSVDHLDYHGDMLSYKDAKLKLFYQSKNRLANADSDYSAPFVSMAKTYSVYGSSDFYAENVCVTVNGCSYDLFCDGKKYPVSLSVTGLFNVYNSLAAISSAIMLGIDAKKAADSVKKFDGVCGRMEKIAVNAPFSVYIDFAHTPDGLLNLLISLRSFVKGKMILVFGCGGDRDRSKRPEMGRIAVGYADHVVITSDNPRSEDPKKIIEDIISGIPESNNYTVECDRKDAIKYALSIAKKDDAVILAGKGHEPYQEIKGVKYPFDEREIVIGSL